MEEIKRILKHKRQKKAFNKIKNLSIDIITKQDIKKIKNEFDIIVEAVFGVGIKGKLKEPYYSIIKKINKFSGIKIAVDISSKGFNAEYTVSMHYAKIKNAHVLDIGIPKNIKYIPGN